MVRRQKSQPQARHGRFAALGTQPTEPALMKLAEDVSNPPGAASGPLRPWCVLWRDLSILTMGARRRLAHISRQAAWGFSALGLHYRGHRA
jgi:hypothetical protein